MSERRIREERRERQRGWRRVGYEDMISKGQSGMEKKMGERSGGNTNVRREEGFGGLPSVPLNVLRPIIRVAWGVKKSAYSA